ncbi:hypothetical protein B0H14DRAFT_2480521 [Mycena olivaceomarginata]|nr:hypothetical protein B0H14DRAFT_2480521 [Mycena olivaceomarginata]
MPLFVNWLTTSAPCLSKNSAPMSLRSVFMLRHSTRKMLIEELLNRTWLEKLLCDSYGNYCVQTALDYTEPNQRALLVEGIRPVLTLIRNAPYGKHIQNKLQRDQMDQFGGGGYQHPQSLAPLGTQGMVPQARHMAPGLHTNGLTDMYGGQCGLYAQSSFGESHMAPQHHGLGQSIDGYMLQGNSSHIGLTAQPAPHEADVHAHAGAGGGARAAGVADCERAGVAAVEDMER